MQKEIENYNRLCAEFLGAIDNTHVQGFMLKPGELNLSFDIFDEKIFSNNGSSGWKIKDLKFHSDWYWIIKVVEAIYKTQNPRKSEDTTHSTLKRDIQIQLGKLQKERLIKEIDKFLTWYNNEIQTIKRLA